MNWTLLILSFVSFAQAQTVTFSGRAEDSDGKPAYFEKHEIVYKDDKVLNSKTTYLKSKTDTDPIAELVSDYSKSKYLPEYSFTDFRTKHKEGIRIVDAKLQAFSDEKTSDLDAASDPNQKLKSIGGQGFHYFIQDFLESFKESENKVVKFILPAKLRDFPFRIVLKGRDDNKTLLRFEPDQWIIRMLAPHMDVTYSNNEKRLLEYRGPSNVFDEKGNIQNVVIQYDYGT